MFRLLYKSHLLVISVTLLVLGLGNYITAAARTEHYNALLVELTSHTQPTSLLLPQEDTALFLNETRERWEIARAKLDYYQVVASAGRLMMSVGLLLAAFSLVRLRRQRFTLTSI